MNSNHRTYSEYTITDFEGDDKPRIVSAHRLERSDSPIVVLRFYNKEGVRTKIKLTEKAAIATVMALTDVLPTE